MRKRRVGLYYQLGYLAALLLLARTDSLTPSLVLELCLQAGGLKVVTIKGEESYGERGLWLPTVILSPLKTWQGWDRVACPVSHFWVLVCVDTVYFCCLCSDNHGLLLPSVTVGISKCLPKSVDPHTTWGHGYSELHFAYRRLKDAEELYSRIRHSRRRRETFGHSSYFPDFSSQHRWVLLFNPCFLKAPTVSNNCSPKKSRY